MNPAFNGSGEIPLIADDPRVIAFDKLEPWQVDQLISPVGEETISQSNANLMSIDRIVTDWLQSLTDKEWTKIKNQKSLYGVRLPDKWIIVWRTILKEPGLRDSKKAARGGQGLNSYTYIWNIWAEECIEKYLSPMEKDLLDLVDQGWLYSEIGDYMVGTYGDEFWKPRKENTKTTPSQVVNNYLYLKMPNKIVRGELGDMLKMIAKK